MSIKSGKSVQFALKMSEILNYGALNLAMSVGYESGVFEAMAELNEAESSHVIADKAGVNERYLLEWLGVMVAGDIIEVVALDSGTEGYLLPKEHVPFLCRQGGNSNLGVYTQEIPLLTLCAKNDVLQGMKTGEGISYDQYSKFYTFMEELADAKHKKVLVSTFLPSVQNGIIVDRLKTGISVCDVGCAEGVALHLMAKAFPNSNFVGIDISEESIEKAHLQAEILGLKNISFRVQDASKSVSNGSEFDYIMAFDSIHDQTHPFEALQNIYKMLKPSGVFSMVDIAANSSIIENKNHPMGPFLYTVSLMHCMPVGLVNGGAGLGMMWGKEKAVEMCKGAGFEHVEVTDIPQDSFNYHYLCVK